MIRIRSVLHCIDVCLKIEKQLMTCVLKSPVGAKLTMQWRRKSLPPTMNYLVLVFKR